MQAVVERPGFSSNLCTKKNIRIVRTLSIDSLEMAQTLSVDNTWPNKLEYSISIPTKSYPIGSPIPINFKLVPLLKGLSIAKIVCTLKEYQAYSIKSGYHGVSATKEVDRTICSTTLMDIEKDVPNWEIDQSLTIPSSLTDCVQDCEVAHIRVRHKLKFIVSLQNPDGHVSELRAALPVSLLIPPQLFSDGFSAPLNPTDPQNQLPSYDSHIYDRLYDGIETPLPSGMNTPAQSRSRRNSNEGGGNLETEAARRALVAGLHRLTAASGTNTPSATFNGSGIDTGSATPNSGHSTPHRSAPSSFTPAFSVDELVTSLQHTGSIHSAGRSPHMPPQEREVPAPFTADEIEGLSRIPSYGTATTRAAAAPLSSSLPDYDHSQPISGANSGTATPNHVQPTAPTLARPEAARTASHRSGVLRAAHDRFTRARDH
ncbi:Arrestin domain-containing protein [Taphrina deformans PYCC 5710]|uniref:Arrestin domain-containing protein n=1 Tax=Taphrina deformans (strain PYCC 5710 / ATCC 11124 / CBS 356.35 / IMI 108563 / JCM 9778 / NBRC 8474) TaxID=1097556 RepID=R4XE20_TAPDE|nr:Arrestin domain-containing protein [Taphrina deformans PYCC 5710]|eukprot:CCG82675.1 Arrestin domain-containing protein [Taphrina deformans PYCC 5710]